MTDVATILRAETTPFERAIETTSGERWVALDDDIIRRSRNPWDCPEHLLSFLAFERSVDIWNEDWLAEKKRSVIDSAPQDHHFKTTEEGHRRYIEIADGELVETLTPPGGFFAAPDLSKEQWDGWISLMPRLRITLGHSQGEWLAPAGCFADVCAVDVDAPGINDGPALYGRRALLRRTADAEDEPLRVVTVTSARTLRNATEFERVVIPGSCSFGLAADDGAAGNDFADAAETQPQVFSYRVDSTYVREQSELSLTSVPIGYDPLDVRFYRESDIGNGRGQFFASMDAAHTGFAGANDGSALLADVLYLHEPSVAAPIVDAMSFANVTRVSFPRKRGEMLIRAEGYLPELSSFVVETSYVGEDAALAEDLSHVEFVMDAVTASKRFTDQIRVSFETTRPITLGQGRRLDQPRALNARTPNHL
jgi:phage tail P2-like protein